MKTDNTLLTRTIEACFGLSMDGRLSAEKRRKFLALGKRLRGSLMNLLTAEFNQGTAAVEEANRMLRSINRRLKQETDSLSNIADTIEQLSSLVSVLDGLIGLPAKFK